ncbi:PREDICTED: cardiotrophin-1 [Galeopterus variegatus]|uniref:Cardiotrophin-1 n=1 Tax=Galeopterus variegatus TaxID=482537 RepID=A0ABM0SID7_GALVR|nr:PREDICTED: cardiotrophin-1 [Galeopterus variegatus]
MSRREGSLEDPQADSSVSLLPHLEAKIRQTHSLAHLLTKYAEQLLQEYVQHQGDPFGLPGFSPPRLPVAGLSSPTPSHAALPAARRTATRAATATVAAGVFPAKVLGLRVCGLYREWVSRTEGDLGQLVPGGPA